jgi:hypothetical protein
MLQRKWTWICPGRHLLLSRAVVVVVDVASEEVVTVVGEESIVDAVMGSFVVAAVGVVMENTEDVVMGSIVVVVVEVAVVAGAAVTHSPLLSTMSLRSLHWARSHSPIDRE